VWSLAGVLPAGAQPAAVSSRTPLNFAPLDPVVLVPDGSGESFTSPSHFRASFFAYGRTFDLELEPNDLFESGAVDEWIGATGSAVAKPAASFYKGRIAGESRSWVRLRYRNGVFDGMMRTADGIYFIEPAARLLGASSPWAMVVYRVLGAAALSPVLAERTLGIGIVADYEYYRRHGERSAANLQNILNQVDGVLREELGVAVQISRTIVYTEPDDPFTDVTAPDALLSEVALFRVSPDSPVGRLDLVHLFTGRTLENDKVGLAYLGAVCDEAYGSVVSQDFSPLNKDAVLLVAHEIAHAFGAPHDAEAGSACGSEPAGYVMSPDSRQELGLQFSECSKTAISSFIASAACLAR
jgi:hypothetical protein